MDVPLAAGQRDRRGDHRHHHGRGEDHDQPRVERAGDQPGEERLAGQLGRLVRGQLPDHVRAEQLLHRVHAEERGEHAADRRQRGGPGDRVGRHPGRGQAGAERRGQRPGQPGDEQREEHADRQHRAGVHRGRPHAGRDAALAGRHAAHHGRGVRRREQPGADPVQRDQRRERPVGKVDREQQQPEERRRDEQQPTGGQAAGRRAGRTVARTAARQRGSPR